MKFLPKFDVSTIADETAVFHVKIMDALPMSGIQSERQAFPAASAAAPGGYRSTKAARRIPAAGILFS
jgi:hypothetical protein